MSVTLKDEQCCMLRGNSHISFMRARYRLQTTDNRREPTAERRRC